MFENNSVKKIKCVVWDLDNTVWDGILLEDKQVYVKPIVIETIKRLDERGILNSIASKNEFDDAMNKLKSFDLDQYFISPQIHWNSKADSIEQIAKNINIGIDTLAFIDDQQYELDEVKYYHPDVLCIHADEVNGMLGRPEFIPNYITEDSKLRRKMYQDEEKRILAEVSFQAPKMEFLKSLEMVMTIKEAEPEDLKRVEELTVRTHQLNTTGYTYSFDELSSFVSDKGHKLFIASLDDRYGSYGKIGILLVECQKDIWMIKLLLMSCRVMTKGVGSVFMSFLTRKAEAENVKLQAEFIHNERNRMMFVTYKFGGFQVISEEGKHCILEYDFNHKSEYPPYVTVQIIP